MLQEKSQPKFIETVFKTLKSMETKMSKPNEAVLEDLNLFVTESASLMLESGHP
jgi:hypothetical protein